MATSFACKGSLQRNAFRQLLKDKQVRFAGYRKPHPLEDMVEIKVQTNGQKTPADAVIDVCDQTQEHISAIEQSFKVTFLSLMFQNAMLMFKNERHHNPRQGLHVQSMNPLY